jgi:hypothetical protein
MYGVAKVCTDCDIQLCLEADSRYEQNKTIKFVKKFFREEFLMENFNPTKSGIYPAYIRIDKDVDPFKYVKILNQKVQKLDPQIWFNIDDLQFVLNSEKQIMYVIIFHKQ